MRPPRAPSGGALQEGGTGEYPPYCEYPMYGEDIGDGTGNKTTRQYKTASCVNLSGYYHAYHKQFKLIHYFHGHL